MRDHEHGDSATAIVSSLNDAESVTDQANMRVASDTTVGTVFTEPAHTMIDKSGGFVPFVNTNSVKAECGS